MILTANNKQLVLNRPHIMGILNVTPDSFSDGGCYQMLDAALAKAEQMIEAGVSIIDIGGESTRPNASEVTVEQELQRVIPVIKALRARSDIWISIDTSKAEVMRQAIACGADIINDIKALQEPGALEVAASANVPVCLMHMQGQPVDMQQNPQYDDIMQEVSQFLCDRVAVCEQAGIKKEQLILDPGFGFGKTVAHNYHLLAHLEQFKQFGLPVLAGLSRKSMIFKLLDKSPQQSVIGSVTCAIIAALKGADIIRVHDVEETIDAMKIIKATYSN